MRLLLLICSISCYFCSCNSSKLILPIVPVQEISGSIIKGRYYWEDKGFSVTAETLNPWVKIIEKQGDSYRTVIFESMIPGPSIRYDVISIEDDKAYINLCLDSDSQKGFLEFFFNKAILPRFMNDDVPVLTIENEEIISKDGWNFYVTVMHGPVSRSSSDFEPSEDYIGTLLSIKGRNLVAITFQKGIFPIADLETAKTQLIPKMIHFFDEFSAEDFPSY